MAKRRVVWHLEVPQHLNQQLEDYIRKDAFKTKSEFIRAAVRDRLKQEIARLSEAKGPFQRTSKKTNIKADLLHAEAMEKKKDEHGKNAKNSKKRG